MLFAPHGLLARLARACNDLKDFTSRTTNYSSIDVPLFWDPQLGTVFPRTFVVRAPGSSSNVASRAGCLSERTAGGASEILLYEDARYKFAFYYYYYYIA